MATYPPSVLGSTSEAFSDKLQTYVATNPDGLLATGKSGALLATSSVCATAMTRCLCATLDLIYVLCHVQYIVTLCSTRSCAVLSCAVLYMCCQPCTSLAWCLCGSAHFFFYWKAKDGRVFDVCMYWFHAESRRQLSGYYASFPFSLHQQLDMALTSHPWLYPHPLSILLT